LLADLTHTEGASPDPSQGLFDREQQTGIGLVQADLKLRFRVRIGLINEISLEGSCCYYGRLGFGSCG
jgi:hypothetical protein